MGYITTFSIYNDGIDLIKEHPVEFAEKLYDAAIKFHANGCEFGLGNHGNLVRVQCSRHSTDETIYVHAGNCVNEVNPYHVGKWKKSCKNSFHKKLLSVLSRDVNQIIDNLDPEDLYDCLLEDLGIIPNKKLPEKLHNAVLAEGIKNGTNESISKYLGRF